MLNHDADTGRLVSRWLILLAGRGACVPVTLQGLLLGLAGAADICLLPC